MIKKTLLDELKKEHKEAGDLFQERVENDERGAAGLVTYAIADTCRHCINLVNKHVKD
ncbi:hypothetical protein [Moraxella bovoculi]|uniref:hypothetical protein n=1 Tax=Moraxella bovoculi TaxID=386891 RepID=UPI000A998105|nr:hypothetical protein [Moraxella bovoculi]